MAKLPISNSRPLHFRCSATLLSAVSCLLVSLTVAAAQVKKDTAPAAPADKVKKAKETLGKAGKIFKKPDKPLSPNLPHVEHPNIAKPNITKLNTPALPHHVIERPDHSRIFTERDGHGGYAQHPFAYRDRELAHRTYYYHGRLYSRYYVRHQYRGVVLYYYAPAHYYRPAFYAWAYYPWPNQVPYVWNFDGSPWYAYYGYYFTPAPIYPGLSLWLTDYLFSTRLAAYYQEHAPPLLATPPTGSSPITPEVRSLISAEVQRQLALENVEAANAQAGVPDPASSSIQRLLADPVPPALVVENELAVVTATGESCALTPGDALQLAASPAPDSTAASMLVLSSKGGPECPSGAKVSVSVEDLQEMQNGMRATIDAGLAELHNPPGSAATPPPLPIPPSLAEQPVDAGFVAAAPPPDLNVAAEIDTQNKPAAAISIGASIADVVAALGKPEQIGHSATGEIYFYKDRKITFKDGLVSGIVAFDEPPSSNAGGNPPNPGVPDLGSPGDFYWQDPAGKFVPLERMTSKWKGITSPHMEVEGAHSPVRLKSGEKMVFALRFQNEIKPQWLAVWHLETTSKGNRMMPLSSGNLTHELHPKLEKFGTESYRITIPSGLAPGEYTFLFRNWSVFYCFGVD